MPDPETATHEHVSERIEGRVAERDDWARRRRKGIPNDEAVVEGLREQAGGSLDDVPLDPALPELTIGASTVADWVRMTDDIDVACAAQVEYLQNHELIPDDVTVSGYVYEVESGELRHPGERVAEQVNTRVE